LANTHVKRVTTANSPSFNAFYGHYPITVTCDSGATSSLIKHSLAVKCDMPISKTSHTASQADGKTNLDICGEVHITLSRGSFKFLLEAVVVQDLDCDILAGVPFMKHNNISLDIPNDRIVVGGNNHILYNTKVAQQSSSQVRRSQSFLIRSDRKKVIIPGDFIEVKAPTNMPKNTEISFEPRSDSHFTNWPSPDVTSVIDGLIRIPNNSRDIISVTKHQHIAQARFVYLVSSISSSANPTDSLKAQMTNTLPSRDVLASISLDPDKQLTTIEKQCFIDVHMRYESVFNPSIGKYNDKSGKVRASINIGPVEPPSQKGRLPSYNRKNMDELQSKMDDLELMGVLAKPEDVDVTVEYVSPSFLVRKPGGGSRLVTAFNNIGNYAKPPPSRVTTSNDVLKFLAQWRFIIKSDMTSQFFQLPMKKSSMKYLGVVTPYKGTRVYTRAAMGMPGSTEHLDELMFRVLGDLIHANKVVKIADDLYIGGNTLSALLSNWEEVLQRFDLNNLRLSASKTVICPITTTILGWIWSAGSISVSPHKIAPLATCDRPSTVKGLRSWLGAYKHIKACISQYSVRLGDLETAVAGKDSHGRIAWTDILIRSFSAAQAALNDVKTLTIPKPSDHLIITNDGALRNGGIGSVLYVMRDGNMRLGGYHSAKLSAHQVKWLPCEVEALAISSAINHWSPYLIESSHPVQVLTDSKPCIQAYSKLARGEFSSSARVSTFLSTLSRYDVELQHIPGSANLPADYLSRNPMQCSSGKCQICTFIKESEQATIRSIAVKDVLDGKLPMPFTNVTAWKQTQQDCPSLRRVYSHLSQGTRPTKKMTGIKDIKRYLQVVTIGHDGTLIVKRPQPFTAVRNLTVIPRHIMPGLLTALHLRLQHPSKSELLKLFQRYFYALDSETLINRITSECAQCSALAKLPSQVAEFSTSLPPTIPGTSFACDILCRARQKILLMRDTFSSYTTAKLVPAETKDALRAAIIETTADLKCADGAIIRVDGATALQALVTDSTLNSLNLTLEVGRLKNINKNPIAEKAVQELEMELKRQHPEGGPITSVQLALAVAALNRRIRNRGLSAKEILCRRDALTGEQLNFVDEDLSNQQYQKRLQNHLPSAKSKAPKGRPAVKSEMTPGMIVYLRQDGDKHTARDRYIITSCSSEFVTVKKLVGSRFSSKDYVVQLADVFCVPYASSDHNYRKAVRSDPFHSESDSSDEGDNAEPSEPLDDKLEYESQSSDNHSTSDSDSHDVLDNNIPSVFHDNDARTTRSRKPPSWIKSGEWDVG